MDWPFPNAKDVIARLDKRFPPHKFASLDDATKNAVISAVGKPLSTTDDVQAAVDAMRKAIAMIESGTAEARLEYLRGAVDLQVSKGSGLLAFTAIIAAVAGLGLEKLQADGTAFVLCAVGGGFALFASLMSLFVVWSSAPTAEQFENTASESRWLAVLLASRGSKANWAVVHSILATGILAVAAAVFVWPASAEALKQEQAPPPMEEAAKSEAGAIAEPAPASKPHQGA